MKDDHSVERSGIRPREDGPPLVLLAAPLPLVPAEPLAVAEAIAHALTPHVVFLRVSCGATSAHAFDPRPAGPRARHTSAPERSVIDDCGEFLPVVAASAKMLRPDLVVVPDVRDATGRAIRSLAVECGAPVLLMRGLAGSKVIVAATELSDPSLPVLRAATLVSCALGARLVFVHNLNPSMSTVPGGAEMRKGHRPSILDRLDDLVSAAYALRVESDNVVTTRQATHEALLSVVESQRPDVVAVGARPRADVPEWTAPLAETAIDETSASVLVVPHKLPSASRQTRFAR